MDAFAREELIPRGRIFSNVRILSHRQKMQKISNIQNFFHVVFTFYRPCSNLRRGSNLLSALKVGRVIVAVLGEVFNLNRDIPRIPCRIY